MIKKERDHFNLLCDIGDLSALLTESSDIESFLQSAVAMVSRYLNADVCSIYLYDEKSDDLVLKATVGLNPSAVGRIRMKPGEGLVGKTFEMLRPIREPAAALNPNFKYFKEANEDRFESFLSVPIQRGSRKIGVMAVQHEKQDYFTEIDVVVLRALASQLAGTVENARLMLDLHNSAPRQPAPSSVSDMFESLRFVKGQSASGGYAFAASTVFRRSHGTLLEKDDAEEDGIYSLEDFYRAVHKTAEQLVEFQSRLAERLIESASLIFDAHFMILKDAQFINKIVKQIMEGISPPRAVKEVAGHYIRIFSSSPNTYIREKVNDMEDLAGRILKNLYNWSPDDEALCEDRIVTAGELYPSEMLKLASEDVKGVILVSGGVTSHVSILARSLKIPLIIADRPDLLNLPEGTPILLDAEIGNIYVRPSPQVIRQFENRKSSEKKTESFKAVMSPITHTQDGVRICLMANINLLSELPGARELKAEGIGLYRTEFPFLIRPTFPSEEEQFLIYRRLADEMCGQEITIRTLDVGGDKTLAYSDATGGSNPELGLRSIRFSLRFRDIFEQQLRAILRAAAETENVRIMFPMISSIDEFREARQVLSDCIAALEREKIPHHPGPAVGMMVELPSVMELIHEFAQEADFFSIGTNDFVQYLIGVDRTNEKVAEYYRPYHPSVLRSLAKIVKAVTEAGKDISVCGEMAHETEYLPFLLGIGIRKLSADPQFLPMLQKRISLMTLAEAEAHTKSLLEKSTIKEIRKDMYPE